jgi:hypothetical protein
MEDPCRQDRWQLEILLGFACIDLTSTETPVQTVTHIQALQVSRTLVTALWLVKHEVCNDFKFSHCNNKNLLSYIQLLSLMLSGSLHTIN